jgi:DNA-directed RNA polymerase II subunit RPB2
VEKDSGIKAGYSNQEYESTGATLVTTLSEKTNIITAVNAFYNTKSKYVKNSSIITLSDIRTNEEVSRVCEENDLSLFAMEFVPRIARAQKLDALSSQASIAGYRAGLLAATSLKKYLSSISKNQNTSQDDIFTKPDPNKVIGIRHGSYDKLNPSGFVPEETVINNGDIILAKIKPIQQDIKTNSEKAFKDDSEVYKSHAPGVVDRIYTKIYNQDMFETRKMLVRAERIPHIGDKFCSRHGQKGTCGILLKASDMPHTRNGIRPDIIVNPNAIPSRMTIGQLIESLLGKKCALKREEADGTPFEPRNIDKVREELKELGYDEDGREYLYNGMTGERMEVRIFIGPTFYQRLKHMVQDKIHSRSRGPTTTLTRQAPEGRSRDGGLRLGEMERDAVAAHGLSKFLKERLLDNSDAYSTYVCGECGLFAQRANRRNNKKFPTADDVYFCPQCDNYNNIHKVRIPYAFKLMIQELMSMCIAPRIRVVDN